MRRILICALLTLLLIGLPVGPGSAMVSPFPLSDNGSTPSLSAAATTPFNCTYSPEGEDLLNSASQTAWQGWIERLSGVTPVMVNGQQVTITSRHSSAMFMGARPSRAFDYLKEQVLALYPSEQVREQDVPYLSSTFKNLIVTLPGQTPSG